MRYTLLALVGFTVLLAFLFSCAGTVYVTDPPPAPKDEIKRLLRFRKRFGWKDTGNGPVGIIYGSPVIGSRILMVLG